jgi:hypothetical protein
MPRLFTNPFSTPVTEDDIYRRQQQAQMLMQFGSQPGGGLPAGLATLLGGIQSTQAMRGYERLKSEAEAERRALNEAIGALLAGGDIKGAALKMAGSRDPQMAATGLNFLMEAAKPKPIDIAEHIWEDATPESRSAYLKSRDIGDLVIKGEPINEIDAAKVDMYRARAAEALARAAAANRPSAPTDTDRKIDELVRRGATDEEIKRMLLGPAPQQSALERERERLQARREYDAPIKLAAVRSAEDALEQLAQLNRAGVGGEISGTLAKVVPGGTALNRYAKAFNNAVAVLNEEILRLTRIPGIGHQSNLETIKAEIASIQYDAPEPVTAHNIDRIRKKLAALRWAFENPDIVGKSFEDVKTIDGKIAEEVKTIDGKTYVKIGSNWYQE